MYNAFIMDGGLNQTNNFTTVSAPYSVGALDSFVYITTSDDLTLPLAANAGVGKVITLISAVGSNQVSVSGSDSFAPSGTVTHLGHSAPLNTSGFYSDGISTWYNIYIS